jgi:hypothetical protein
VLVEPIAKAREAVMWVVGKLAGALQAAEDAGGSTSTVSSWTTSSSSSINHLNSSKYFFP